MKNKLFLFLAVVALLCLGGWSGYGQRSSSVKPSWEYKELRSSVGEKELNDLGSQGWELVAVLENLQLSEGSGVGHPVYYLKRAR